MEKVIQVCGMPVGRKEQFSTCDKPPGHPVGRGYGKGCSSPELRTYMLNAKNKSIQKKKARETVPAIIPLEEDLQEEVEFTPEEIADEKFYDDIERVYGSIGAWVKHLEQRKAENDAAEAFLVEKRERRSEEEQFITRCLDQSEAGQAVDTKKFEPSMASYLHVEPKTLRLDPEIRRSILSRAVFGVLINGKRYGPTLTEFRQRLAKFLQVTSDPRDQVRKYMIHPPTLPTDTPADIPKGYREDPEYVEPNPWKNDGNLVFPDGTPRF